MQAGFLCLESGSTRTKNSINVGVKNLSDFGLSVLLYWAIGFGIMFGYTSGGWWGQSHFAPSLEADNGWTAGFFIFQAMFCGTAVTIVSGAVAERMTFKGYMAIAASVSLVIYPLFGHWAWGGALHGEPGWLSRIGFIDFAGSSVVHSLGGWSALAAILLIGPRLGRFDKAGNTRQPPGQSLPLAMLGTLLLCFGWIGFNGGSTLAWNAEVPVIVVNTLLAAASGIAVASLSSTLILGYLNPKYTMNGSLAGLVAITANCHIVNSASAIVIGAIGAIVMVCADRLLERLRLDDVVSSFAVHGAAGAWGTLAVALFGELEAFGGRTRFEQLGIQATGIATCALLSFGGVYLFMRLTRAYIRYRVSDDEELVGLNVAEHNESTEHLDLLREMEATSAYQDLSRRVTVEPYTEVGQIAARYNRVLDSLQETVARNDLIIRDMKDSILTCAQSGALLDANPSAEALFGISATRIASRSLLELIERSDGQAHASARALIDAVQAQSSASRPARMRAKRQDGLRFPIELEAIRGRVEGHAIITLKIRDLSSSERHEQELHLAKEDAEKSRDALRDKVVQIESFNNLAIDREARMIELKQQINRLSRELGRKAPY